MEHVFFPSKKCNFPVCWVRSVCPGVLVCPREPVCPKTSVYLRMPVCPGVFACPEVSVHSICLFKDVCLSRGCLSIQPPESCLSHPLNQGTEATNRRDFMGKAYSPLESFKSNQNGNSYTFPIVCHCCASQGAHSLKNRYLSAANDSAQTPKGQGWHKAVVMHRGEMRPPLLLFPPGSLQNTL